MLKYKNIDKVSLNISSCQTSDNAESDHILTIESKFKDLKAI